MKLYYHETDGGAKYLMDTFLSWEHNGKKGKEGTITDKTKYVIRIDGNIREDAEMDIRENLCPSCGFNLLGLTKKELKREEETAKRIVAGEIED